MPDMWSKVGVVGSWLGGLLTAIIERYVLPNLPVRIERLFPPSAPPSNHPLYERIDVLAEAITRHSAAVDRNSAALDRNTEEIRTLRRSQEAQSLQPFDVVTTVKRRHS